MYLIDNPFLLCKPEDYYEDIKENYLDGFRRFGHDENPPQYACKVVELLRI